MDSGFIIDIFKLFFENRVIGVIVINVRKYVFFMAVSLANHKFTVAAMDDFVKSNCLFTYYGFFMNEI
jgi:hypothetical protein